MSPTTAPAPPQMPSPLKSMSPGLPAVKISPLGATTNGLRHIAEARKGGEAVTLGYVPVIC